MENAHKTLHLYIPISERSCVSPPLSNYRSPASPFEAPVKPQQGLTSNCKEEGPAKTVKQGQGDRFDLKETLKVLDDSSEIPWLTELFPLCLECQAFMKMGNQQGTKMKPNDHGYAESRDTLPKSPRFQIPLKRQRRTEGVVYTGRVPQKAKLQKTSAPAFREQDLEEDWHTPEGRRKRVMGKVSLLDEVKPVWRLKQPDASSENFTFSKDYLFSPRKEECALPDSDLSEYENDMYITPTSLALTKKTEDHTQKDAEGEKTAEGGEEKSFQWWYEETRKKAAAQRVMGKIEEVEGIIRRVSLTSSDWIREDNRRDEAQFVSDGCRADFGSQLETKNQKRRNEDKPLLVEELQALGEALSQSLRQVLKLEGAKAEGEPFTKTKKTFNEANLVGSTRRPLNISSDFTSTVPNNSSPPSQSLTAILDVSQRTSSSFEDMSPILSPLLTSSQHRLSLTDEREKDISDRHVSSVEDSLFPPGAGGCESAATDSWGTENDQKNSRRQATLRRLGEQTRTSEASQDYLLSSAQSGFEDAESSITVRSLSALLSEAMATDLLEIIAKLFEKSIIDLNKSQHFHKHHVIDTSQQEDNKQQVYYDHQAVDEALQRQEEIWQQEVEESLSFCRSLSHPSRPKHIDFLRITAPEDDIMDSPTTTPLPLEFWWSLVSLEPLFYSPVDRGSTNVLTQSAVDKEFLVVT
ncbi:hypothetical protein D9C73_009531 [Collichthys lucidus]|uniref:Uncharacterized protein n=1 Tax=Collichthys lucidus TaxID=240159 RepID=A0A4U5UMY9_COLLU|nr:hypothetical protein D9C73_009531 [Collichthys lucidus]